MAAVALAPDVDHRSSLTVPAAPSPQPKPDPLASLISNLNQITKGFTYLKSTVASEIKGAEVYRKLAAKKVTWGEEEEAGFRSDGVPIVPVSVIGQGVYSKANFSISTWESTTARLLARSVKEAMEMGKEIAFSLDPDKAQKQLAFSRREGGMIDRSGIAIEAHAASLLASRNLSETRGAINHPSGLQEKMARIEKLLKPLEEVLQNANLVREMEATHREAITTRTGSTTPFKLLEMKPWQIMPGRSQKVA